MKTHTTYRYLYLAGALISLALAEIPFFGGKGHLFSGHMVRHILLLLITAPLFALALGERPAGGRSHEVSRRLSGVPWLNWLAGVGVMWLWHIPGLLNALLASEGPTGHGHLQLLSFMHTCSLLLAGFLFAWPLASPFRSHRLSPPEAILYLTSACIACVLLGFLITFATPGVYNSGSLIADQRLAGLIMWVPCTLLYLAGVIYLLREWLGEEEMWKSHDFYRKRPNKRLQRQETIIYQTEEPTPEHSFRSGVIITQLGIIDPSGAVDAEATAKVALYPGVQA
jgi:putative membrane protein